MAFPTSYTEITLGQFMYKTLGDVATVLGISEPTEDANSLEEAVYETLINYGTDDISTISGLQNIKKLRVLAKEAAWQFAVDNLAAQYKFSADGASFELQQIYEQAKKNLESARIDAFAYDPTYRATIGKVRFERDPYQTEYDTEDDV